ncbi:MAG: cyclic lactone autoinducer peptide [Oscillospiraceae bacterium]|nr:cyclic lactone autoinducer peptide [Oscillospiraceae bacterium]
MNMILNVLAAFIKGAANVASASTSLFIYYQPKKPECLCKKESDEK